MSHDKATLLAAIMRLPEGERRELIEQVWKSLPHDDLDFELTEEQSAEFDRRIAGMSDIRAERSPGSRSWRICGSA